MNNTLKEYATFVRTRMIKEFVDSDVAFINSFNIPIMEFFRHLSKEQLNHVVEERLVRFLLGVESGTVLQDTDENLQNFKTVGLSGVPKNAVSIKDLVLIYSAQKISFQQFIKEYTTNVFMAVQVMQEIELLYKQIQEKAVEVLESIREEEQMLRIDTEEKFKRLFDNAGDMIQIVSIEGFILSVNKLWKEKMGYNEEELKDKMIYDLVAESERTKYIELRKDIIQTNNTFNEISTCFVTKTDEKISVEGSISTIFKDGQPQYTFGIFRDVTQRLRQEKELRSANEQLLEREEHARKLIHNAPDAVIVINVDNIITLWNPKAESIFGFTAEEVTGKTLSDTIIPVAAREGHKQGMQRFLATGEAHILNKTIEVTALHKSGYEFPVSLTVSQSKQAGKVVFISFLRDITTQKKNELEIESKRQQLERSNQELEQFAWLTSHDLKEPLRKILTFSDALLKKHQQNVPPDTLQYLQKIHTSAFRMSNLIEAILLYSNVADAKELFVPCNLNQVLAEVLDDLELIIANKKAVIHTSKLPVIKAIPIQMRQLLQNLLSNGIKYSKPDVTPVIHIYCTTVAHGYQITFTDNGIGFEKAYTEKIFQVFQRLLTNKAYEGTGIGLALCKKIVENHKGTIVAEGEPGEGARFIITLPSR